MGFFYGVFGALVLGRMMLFRVDDSVVYHTTVEKQTVTFWSEAYKLLETHPIQFIFHFSDYFFVLVIIVGMVEWVLGKVVFVSVLQHIRVNILGLYLVQERIRIGKTETQSLGSIFWKHFLVVKFVH